MRFISVLLWIPGVSLPGSRVYYANPLPGPKLRGEYCESSSSG
jgi:hypothetical protein